MSDIRKLVVSFAIAFLVVGFFMSCSTSAQSQNIQDALLEVDALVNMGETEQALKDLKSLEKKALDKWQVLGVYKRYSALGESKLAEKLLAKSIKKNPGTVELNVVYAKFLIDEGRLQEAEKYAKQLKNTDYSALYSEYVFKSRQLEFAQGDINRFLLDDEYLTLFSDAYSASRNPVWLRNSASFYLNKGLYNKAALLTPGSFFSSQDAFFWALVNFDSGNYAQALDCIHSAYVFEASAPKLSEAEMITLRSLESDSWYLDFDSESAEKARQNLIAMYNIGGEVSEDLKNNDLLPLTFTNSALWNLHAGNNEKARDLLETAVFNFPLYVPAVLAYADFAYESNLEREEDQETKALRRNGNRTLEMERYDSRPKLPLSDAMYKIEYALGKTKDPYLYIAKLDLRYKTDSKLTNEQKKYELWKLLEEESYETALFNDVLVRYTLSFFLKNKLYDESYTLFYKYMTKKYGIPREAPFFEQIADQVKIIDIEDSEIALYFALYYKMAECAKRIGEYICFESTGIRNANELTSTVSTEAVMNLANFYYSTGKVDDALDLYGKASGREEKRNLRSECFYRIAEIYKNEGQEKNALRAVEYACSVYPENAKAWLLKTRLLKNENK